MIYSRFALLKYYNKDEKTRNSSPARNMREISRTPRMRANNGSRLRTLISSAPRAKWYTYIYVRTCVQNARDEIDALNFSTPFFFFFFFKTSYISKFCVRLGNCNSYKSHLIELIKSVRNLHNFLVLQVCNAAKRKIRFSKTVKLRNSIRYTV